MDISNTLLIFFIITIFCMVVFILSIVSTRNVMLIHKIYFGAAIVLIIWLLALIGINFTSPDNLSMLYFWDSLTTSGAALLPACSLLFAICYTREYEKKLPKKFWWLFAVPGLTIFMVSTNQLHHLYYRVFSFFNASVVFGPYFFVHCIYTFSCVALSVILITSYAVKSKSRLHYWQAALFDIGSLAPSVVNLLILSNTIETSVVATPISFIVTMVFHGIIIYRLHFFDIQPLAMKQLIELTHDGYLVTNPSGLIISSNQSFRNVLGRQYGIKENVFLHNCIRNEDMENKTAIYNLLTAISTSSESRSRVTYEQVIYQAKAGELARCFYLVEVTPLIVKEQLCGLLTVFKDITEIKVNMQKLQDSQVKMMEQERLAFLGQMVGGLAHNLKTPIMSISGGLTSIENLILESQASLGDPEVTLDDYREIYGEMDTWISRMRDACAYMSDIISTVKGQASNMNTSEQVEFSLEEAFKRVSLLLRHELVSAGCSLHFDGLESRLVTLNGDINNLVQVLSNLVSNAIDAQLPGGRHEILLEVRKEEPDLLLCVIDYGSGIPDNVRKKLLSQMVTSKGTKGTGLGVFISNTVIRAKFGGNMRFEDNPEGGTVWVISIPLENVDIAAGKG
ncbi:MAG: histidine kinase N-terminal 7TM domain-containing protein [Candidatus Limivivens sp.]|nr:histidine kinase N-terminal 7TM domain-containing protein [Candidatus Limivivens sp.]